MEKRVEIYSDGKTGINDAEVKNESNLVIRNVLRNYGAIIGMLLVLIVFQILNNKFLTARNLLGVLNQSSILIIMSLGAMMVMSVRGVDLSVAQVADASGLIAAILLLKGFSVWAAFTAAIGFGALIGCINALFMAYLGIPAIIGTLGMMFMIRSGELILTNGAQPQILFTLEPDVADKFFFLGQGKIGTVPFLIIFTIVIVILAYFIRQRTVVGRHMDAVEGNVRAAFLASINIRKVFGSAFIMSSILCSIAGVVLVSRAGSAVPRGAEPYLLDCMVAVYLGTLASSRNKMNVLGTVMGALFVALIANWLTLMGLGAPYKYALNGAFILFALSIGVLRREN